MARKTERRYPGKCSSETKLTVDGVSCVSLGVQAIGQDEILPVCKTVESKIGVVFPLVDFLLYTLL